MNRIQRVVDFALKKCTLDDFDFLIEASVGGSGADYQIARSKAEEEDFRSRVESILVTLAEGGSVTLPSFALRVTVDGHGVHYSSDDPTDMQRRWRVIENALAGQVWRLRICPWEKCRRLFVKRGRSEYCDLKHAAAAQRQRRKQRKIAELTLKGEVQ